MEEKINNSKLYELVLNCKIETEKNRDEINKYYTVLSSSNLGEPRTEVLSLLGN